MRPARADEQPSFAFVTPPPGRGRHPGARAPRLRACRHRFTRGGPRDRSGRDNRDPYPAAGCAGVHRCTGRPGAVDEHDRTDLRPVFRSMGVLPPLRGTRRWSHPGQAGDRTAGHPRGRRTAVLSGVRAPEPDPDRGHAARLFRDGRRRVHRREQAGAAAGRPGCRDHRGPRRRRERTARHRCAPPWAGGTSRSVGRAVRVAGRVHGAAGGTGPGDPAAGGFIRPQGAQLRP